MFNSTLDGQIDDLFVKMETRVNSIIQTAPNFDVATKQIVEYVSNTLTAESVGYLLTIYAELSARTLQEDIFQSHKHANKFYELGLRQKLLDAYEFHVTDLAAYQHGINLKEINRTYATAAAAAGGAAAGSVLLGVLSGVVEIPFVVIIAGALLAAIATAGFTHYKVVPDMNKKNYVAGVDTFLKDLKHDILNWIDEVVNYYDQTIEELKKTL